MSFPILTDNRESPGVTFADPGSTRSVGQVALDALASVGRTVSDPYVNPQPYADIFHAAERSMRLTGNIVSEGQARAEAYDQRIKAAKAAAGIDLENPERGGYAIDARKAIAQEVRTGGIASIDAKGGIPEYQRRIFDRKLAELQKDHPELQFGDADAQARALAKGATEDVAKATSADVNPVASLAFQFAGGLVGSRRDPLFIGSLFAGPTTAVGRTALARVASSSLFTGLYNAGVSAAEQPTVQDWRARIGVEHGVLPAMQDVGLAFLTGAIPGAGIQAIKESVRAPLQRVLAGHPEPGDIAAIHDVIPLAERDHAALQAGEESVAADKATLTIPAAKDIPEPLHNDMLAAALKRADDPAEPSPAAVQMVRAIEAYHGSPHDFDAFSIDRIGSGEGAQAYGHGLYFAENQAVARSYQLLNDAKINGRPFDINNPLHKAVGMVDEFGSREAAIKETKARLARDIGDFYGDVLRHLESDKPLPAMQTTGSMYGVRIHADQGRMLDWDKPVEDRILKAIPEDVRQVMEDRLEEAGKSSDLTAYTGGEIYQALSHATDDSQYASKILHEAGISGIKYLDQGSRGAGDGTRNFVVFNDKDVEITHKNGEPVRPAPPAEVMDRLAQAGPKSEAEAHLVADEVLDDVGRNVGMAALRDRMATADAERAPPAIPPEEPAAAPRARGDVIDKVPWVDGEGRPKLLGAKGAAAVGERETTLSMLVRSCK